MSKKNERKQLTRKQLKKLAIYSELHDDLLEILLGDELPLLVRFKLEDALLRALKFNDSRKDFVEVSMLAAGAPRLIRAIEREWAESRVYVHEYQNPEVSAVQLYMHIHDDARHSPSLADSILEPGTYDVAESILKLH